MTIKAARRSRTVPELVEKLSMRFPDGPPAEQDVEEQGFTSYNQHWTDRWPTTLATPRALSNSERTRVTRQSLLISAKDVQTEDDAVDFYVRVCSWGVGPMARGVARCVKPLHQPGAANALLATHSMVRPGHVLHAYSSLWRGDNRIKFLGPAFFTKWLYFSAYGDWKSEALAPLILDARVAKALGWWPQGWSATDYNIYLERAEELRQQWCPDRGLHVVEYALFKLGAKTEGVDDDR